MYLLIIFPVCVSLICMVTFSQRLDRQQRRHIIFSCQRFVVVVCRACEIVKTNCSGIQACLQLLARDQFIWIYIYIFTLVYSVLLFTLTIHSFCFSFSIYFKLHCIHFFFIFFCTQPMLNILFSFTFFSSFFHKNQSLSLLKTCKIVLELHQQSFDQCVFLYNMREMYMAVYFFISFNSLFNKSYKYNETDKLYT